MAAITAQPTSEGINILNSDLKVSVKKFALIGATSFTNVTIDALVSNPNANYSSLQPYIFAELDIESAVYDENGERLPATYANFLIINGAVLVPTYNSPKDEIAIQQIQKAFPDREIIGIDCRALIKQHGSLHCVTMQFPV